MSRVLAIDTTMVARFFAKTERVGECLEWRGVLDRDGYGRYRPKRGAAQANWMAHRFAYVAAKGEIPAGHHVDHLCRNRACVEPDHLEAVTPRENHDRWSTAITHCRHGHAYTPENTHINRKGARTCRACKRELARRIYWKDRAP